MEILRQKIKADKKLVVAANMNLTEAEAKAFWPVYDAYANLKGYYEFDARNRSEGWNVWLTLAIRLRSGNNGAFSKTALPSGFCTVKTSEEGRAG